LSEAERQHAPRPAPHAPSLPAGLRELAPSFDVALCDVWGVIHDGHAVFPGAAEALAAFRRGNGVVILVSNAPRPSETIVPQLDCLGFPRAAWDAIVTSGDVTRTHIAAQHGKRIFHLGPQRDLPLFAGHPVELTPEEMAEVVVCTGLFDDTVETPDDYAAMLRRLRSRELAMICANPDFVVQRGGHLIYCAGAIADAYARMGGEVVFCGKPHKPIYDAAIGVAESLLKRMIAVDRVLAIGDSVRTDLAGASALGFGALFIAGGIHALDAGHEAERLDTLALKQFLASQAATPDAAMARLVW
jgi:HAD superfamily hydrolase (TIGR01459 family)